jgi:hypothetical protein
MTRARSGPRALDLSGLAGALVAPALAGTAAGLGVLATADPAAVAEAGGAARLVGGCVRMCYLLAAAAGLAAGLSAATDGGPFAGPGAPPAAEAGAVWARFPNGFDAAAMAAVAAWGVLRLTG